MLTQYSNVATLNEVTGGQEILLKAVLIAISADVRHTKPSGPTNTPKPYHIATVEITYPDGQKATVMGGIWAKSIEKNPQAFVPGAEVAYRVQVDGDYAGFAKVELPPAARADLGRLGIVWANQQAPVQAGQPVQPMQVVQPVPQGQPQPQVGAVPGQPVQNLT